MRDNESEKEEVKDVVDESSKENDSDSDDSDSDENEDDDEETDDDYDEDEIDIGSHIGLVLEDEEVFGVIIEFDDEEGLVTIEEDGTGDLVTGYQDEMFLED